MVMILRTWRGLARLRCLPVEAKQADSVDSGLLNMTAMQALPQDDMDTLNLWVYICRKGMGWS